MKIPRSSKILLCNRLNLPPSHQQTTPDLQGRQSRDKMRLSPILLQGAAAAQATARSRPKLPLPATLPPNFKARLLPSLTSQIPSVVNCPTTFAPIFIRPDQKMRLQLWGDGKYFFKWFKAWITFYRAGIAQTVANMRLRKQLKKELKSCMRNVNIPGSMNITMTRSEFQMMVRTRQDMMKLPGTFASKTVAKISVFVFDVYYCRIHAYCSLVIGQLVPSVHLPPSEVS